MIAKLKNEGFSISFICSILEVNRSGYYAYEAKENSLRAQEDKQLMALIEATFWSHKRRYGARRIRSVLEDMGQFCGRKRVSKLMKELRLKAIQPKSFIPKTTDSNHSLGYATNLLLDAGKPTTINQIWVGDISYIPLKTGNFIFLSMLIDLYSRRIVGWALLESMKEELVLTSLRDAIANRQPLPGLIHHSDRGGQYAGKNYRSTLRRARIKQSMSRADNCYDNAFMESCFSTIKRELEMTSYESIATARKELRAYFLYYNTLRKHSSLYYLTPQQFELAYHSSSSTV